MSSITLLPLLTVYWFLACAFLTRFLWFSPQWLRLLLDCRCSSEVEEGAGGAMTEEPYYCLFWCYYVIKCSNIRSKTSLESFYIMSLLSFCFLVLQFSNCSGIEFARCIGSNVAAASDDNLASDKVVWSFAARLFSAFLLWASKNGAAIWHPVELFFNRSVLHRLSSEVVADESTDESATAVTSC